MECLKNTHEVVIAGAGPGGSVAAHYLAQQGMDVLLLDKAEFPRDKTCGDGLTPHALDVLDDMGILPDLHRIGYRINGIELHASKGNVMTAPIPDKIGYPNYSMVVPRMDLDNAIRECAVASGAAFQSQVRVKGVEQTGDHVMVRGERNRRSVVIRARIAILAVGANLRLLLQMGILKQTPRLLLAARAYYEGVTGLTDRIQAHFENVPLPGYGWVFPLSETSANIGVGYWQSCIPWRRPPCSIRAAMEDFLQNRKLKAMLAKAERTSPIKGYPLRIDFATAPTYSDRILLVGETAGLVSPLTGEGIDFALKSGKLASEFLEKAFEVGDFSRQSLDGYDRLLRKHFQRLFIFLGYLRRLYVNPILMNRAVRAAETDPELKNMLVNIMMSHQDAADMVNISTLRKVVFGM